MDEYFKKFFFLINSNKSIIILSLVFIILYSINLDKFPHVNIDENWFSNPANILVLNGKLGTTLFYGFDNMQNFTYWQPPAYLLLLALSFKIFGLGVIQGRIVSLLLGLISLIFTYAIATELYNKNVGIIAASLLTFNFLFFFSAREMRMEIAVACFTLISVFLIILALKKSNLTYYVLSGLFAMLALLSHPNGLIAIITIYVMIFVYKLSNSVNILQGIISFFKEKGVYYYSLGLILTSIPYIIYIMMDFTSFKKQFMFNIGYSVFNPINNILQEPFRYTFSAIYFYGTIGGIHISLLDFIMGSLIVFSFTVIVIIFAMKKSKLEDKLLLSIFFSQIFLFALLVSHKSFFYLSILLPYWTILIARILYPYDLKTILKNLFNIKCWKTSIAFIIILIFIISNFSIITFVLYSNNNYNYNTVETEISQIIPYNSIVMGNPDYYDALADNYNYYSLAPPGIIYYEYDSILSLKPDYILLNSQYSSDNQYSLENLSSETKNYLTQNFHEIGIIPLNNNIEGSPIIIYKKN
jgi:4-amino-4-deoxy-L-arabinose transferase-like glycosyltransferase